jgi:hypothetical protein
LAALDKLDEIASRTVDGTGAEGIVAATVKSTTDAVRRLLRKAVENG